MWQDLSHNIHFCYYFCRHVTNLTNFTSCYKISPIIFTITIIFCWHVTNVTNVTSRYKISPIIFTITITFCRHVTNVTIVTSRYKISPYRPLGAIIKTSIKRREGSNLWRCRPLLKYCTQLSTLMWLRPKGTFFYETSWSKCWNKVEKEYHA